MSTIKKTCVAIPVGGKVNLAYLQETFETLKQTDAVIYVGLDEAESLTGLGNYDDVRSLCEQYADKVMLFPRESYYRPGGIWKKILDCWEDSNCEFLRGIGYDDLIPPVAFVAQEKGLRDSSSLQAVYANQTTQYDDDVAGRQFFYTKKSMLGTVFAIGCNPFSFICWAGKRDMLLSSVFKEMTLKGSYGWERLFHAMCFGSPHRHVDTVLHDSPIRREHVHTISSQYNPLTPEQKAQYHRDIFEIAHYSEEQSYADWQSLNVPQYYKQKRVAASPFWGGAANFLWKTPQ